MNAKISKLSGKALNIAVAECEGLDANDHVPDYAGNWADGGPLIAREGIALRKHSESGLWYAMAQCDGGDFQQMNWAEFTALGGKRYGVYSYQIRKRRKRFPGTTPLEAAMRCLVASKTEGEFKDGGRR